MAMRCSICSHSRRLEIDREIVKGTAIAQVAQNFGVSYYSLYSHSREHVSRQLSQAWHKKETEENFDLLSKIDNIIIKTERIFERNYKAKKDGLALKALDSQRNTIQLLAQISYSLHQSKLAELEILKQKSGEKDEYGLNQYKKGLKRLTTPELKLFLKLVDKMSNVSNEPTLLELPEKGEKPFNGVNVLAKAKNAGKSKENGQEQTNRTTRYEELTVLPLEPEIITSSRKSRRRL